MEHIGIFHITGYVVESSSIYLLGDIAVVSHSSPFYGIAVKAIKPVVLAALIGFQEVRMDEESGEKHNVVLY